MTVSQKRFPSADVIPYAELREVIRNGDVLICSGNGFFSHMIRSASGSIWSHVGFILRLDNLDRVMLLESVEPKGVRTVRLSKYLTGYDDDKKHPYNGGLAIIRHKQFDQIVNERKFQKLVQYAIDCFGHPYDTDEIAKIASRILASKIPFTRKQMKKIKPDNEFICSEYVARCYAEIGLKVKWDKRGFVAPSNFAGDQNFELVGVMQDQP